VNDRSSGPELRALQKTIGSGALLEALPIGVYCCGTDGVIRQFNRRAAELWGRTPEIGDTGQRFCGAQRLFLPDGSPLPHDKDPMAIVLRDHTPARDVRIVIERPDGTRVHVAADIDPLFDETGAFMGAVSCFQDISELTRAHGALQASKDELDDFFENAAIGLHVVAADGTILQANKAELELLGYERAEYVGRNIAEFHADRSVIEDMLQRLANGETLWRYPARLLAKDGSIRHVLITSSGCSRGGSIVRTRCFTQDVTEVADAEERVEGSELRFRAALEGMPVAAYTIDTEGFVTFCNRAGIKMAGREPRLGVDKWSILWRIRTPEGESVPAEDSPLAIALRERRSVQGFEFIAERPDGSSVRYIPHPTPLFDAQGRLTGAVNVLVDITQRHRAEVESAHLAAVVASSSDAIVSKTLKGIVMSWNAGAEKIFGYKAEEIVGQPILTIIPPELHQQEAEILARLERGERIEHFETERITKDGRRLNVSLTVSPVLDKRGNIIGASKVARDITDRKRAEKLQRLLVSELNHRVKNTLATVQSLANQTVRLARSPAEFATSFSGRVQALAHAHDLLTRNSWQGADIMMLVRDQLLLNDTEDPRISFSGPSVTLEAAPALHLALVLHELGTNARKYGSLSVPKGRLSISWTVRSGKDSGFLLKWQERGGPAVDVPQRRGFGTTLIGKSLASHGGEVSIRYEAKGVTCEIMLPILEHPPGQSLFGAIQTTTSNYAPHGPVTGSHAEGKRVLVVEDEPIIAMDIATTLSEAGCKVVGPAANLEKARELIADAEFDIALLDANLSGDRVDELAAELTRKGIPFAFLTGYEREALPEAFRQAPMVGKPFTQQAAIDIIERLADAGSTVIPIRQKDASGSAS